MWTMLKCGLVFQIIQILAGYLKGCFGVISTVLYKSTWQGCPRRLVQQSWMYSSFILVLRFRLQSEGGQDVVLTWGALVAWWWAEVRLPISADVIVVVIIVVQSVEQRGRCALTPGWHRILELWLWQCLCFIFKPFLFFVLVVYLISLRRALSWLCSCSLVSCCSSRSLCNFFLLCSSRSISSSASSICRFKAFRRRFNFKENQHARGYKRFNKDRKVHTLCDQLTDY